MTIYISGPMTGMPDENRPAFNEVAQALRAAGWDAFNPAENGLPATATWWCALNGLGAAACQPHNPTWALRALVGYDKYLFDRTPVRYGERDRMWVALRSYNGGLGHWQKEAAVSGTAQPSRSQVDAACGKARRAAVHCKENLGYPHRILTVLQPRYLQWGPGL